MSVGVSQFNFSGWHTDCIDDKLLLIQLVKNMRNCKVT